MSPRKHQWETVGQTQQQIGGNPEGLIRTLKTATEDNHGCTSADPLQSVLGRTNSIQRTNGKRWDVWQRSSENAPWQAQSGRRAELRPTIVLAINVCHHGRSGALLTLTEFGAVKTRSITRSPEGTFPGFGAGESEGNRRAVILPTFPKDFAGHGSHGPASSWGLKDFRSLQQEAGEVQRCEVHLCRFASSEQRRAAGCWSNFGAVQQEGHARWPTHVKHAGKLQCAGPLPRSCPCATPHMPMRGTASGHEFNSTHQQTLSVKFWLRALRDSSPTEPFLEG